jgi:hypothetical protein
MLTEIEISLLLQLVILSIIVACAFAMHAIFLLLLAIFQSGLVSEYASFILDTEIYTATTLCCFIRFGSRSSSCHYDPYPT